MSDLGEDENTYAMDSHNVDVNVEGLELAKEELFGCIVSLRNNPPATLTNTEQLIYLVKKCWMMQTIFRLWIMISRVGWVFLNHL